MPDYEYGCAECHCEWEVTQRISDAPVRVCPDCGKETAKRLISRTSFALKGTGWAGDNYGARPPPAAVAVPVKTGPSDATMAAATTCPAIQVKP